jgi:hypothetical protein
MNRKNIFVKRKGKDKSREHRQKCGKYDGKATRRAVEYLSRKPIKGVIGDFFHKKVTNSYEPHSNVPCHTELVQSDPLPRHFCLAFMPPIPAFALGFNLGVMSTNECVERRIDG